MEITQDGLSVETNGIPIEQADRYDADVAECQRSEPSPTPLNQMSDQWWREWYEAELKTNQCLAEHGVGVGDPPSFQSFKDANLTGNGWIAWQAVDPAIGQTAYANLEKACPQPGNR